MTCQISKATAEPICWINRENFRSQQEPTDRTHSSDKCSSEKSAASRTRNIGHTSIYKQICFMPIKYILMDVDASWMCVLVTLTKPKHLTFIEQSVGILIYCFNFNGWWPVSLGILVIWTQHNRPTRSYMCGSGFSLSSTLTHLALWFMTSTHEVVCWCIHNYRLTLQQSAPFVGVCVWY